MNIPASLPAIDIERRFDEAVRAGRPEWLWFEVAEPDWAKAVATIETALRDVLALGRSDDALIDDPVALSIACYTSGTGPLLGSWMEQGKLTTTAANAEILRVHLEHNRARMEQLTARAEEAVNALSEGGTSPVVMKGMHTAHHYFDEPGQRNASDIDLLLCPDQLPVAAEILARLGYEPRKGAFCQRSWAMPGVATQPVTLTYIHRDDPWSIDLHEGVTRKLAGGSRRIEIDALIPTIALEKWHISNGGGIFPPPLLLAHLLTHAGCSFESLTLQRQYEIGLVIRKHGGREGFDWPAFTVLCDRAGLWPFLYPALCCAERLSPNLVPDPIMLRSRDAAPPMVRKLVESHSAASIHRAARWSWAERYMWADGVLPRLRQLIDDLGMPDHLNSRELLQAWQRRIYRQLRRAISKARGLSKRNAP
ncbi:nucleotidyltransferase family protein [Sphingomonas sp. 7/4-4]|uniref:nucleotidyltransferase family protein n=1 Tax=Sphingomonas sp. 7/4-4 TaxID=3018446 RepID=UPI0022F3C53A|nr:nucleotidyltransferase family protein [Sphingomonas sp. 7/4-4]WBY08749.1 nucleotidyltransferase family protein [Sphingomonas sp. 7/4-4]